MSDTATQKTVASIEEGWETWAGSERTLGSMRLVDDVQEPGVLPIRLRPWLLQAFGLKIKYRGGRYCLAKIGSLSLSYRENNNTGKTIEKTTWLRCAVFRKLSRALSIWINKSLPFLPVCDPELHCEEDHSTGCHTPQTSLGRSRSVDGVVMTDQQIPGQGSSTDLCFSCSSVCH